MKKRTRALVAGICVASSILSMTGCSKVVNKVMQSEESVQAQAEETTVSVSNTETDSDTSIPKYIFLFIGDGMSYPQVQLSSYYLSALKNENSDILTSTSNLSFMNFPSTGSAQTYDSTSFCPDSASTATSISTGNKTYSGTINMDETMTVEYETISEKLKEQLGYKIGVITSVNLNHATPAAFYAHQASRNNYYEIGLELIYSNFDYFAGGALLKPTGNDGTQTDLYELAKDAGYNVVTTQKAAKKLSSSDGKSIVIGEALADSNSLSYDLDASDSEWALADYVSKGIEMLDNDNGFFVMVESGKIDWACHANDAGAAINDTIALSNAVDVAIEFYEKYPEDTLILVTGDHETGGLTIGYAGTNYDTFLTNLENQKISYAKFDSDYVAKYKENGTKFKTVLKDIKKLFGLVASTDSKASENSNLVLTDYEYEQLKTAYKRTMASETEDLTQAEYVQYGSYEPLTVTITHILNNKSGINFASYSHTGLPVPVYAIGNGASLFEGYYDNTDIYKNLAQLTGVK